MELVAQSDLNQYFVLAQSLGFVQKYKKFGDVEARLGQAGELIVTRIDGKKETQNTVNEGDVIIRNPDGEIYPIGPGKYRSRYIGPKLTYDFQPVKCQGFAYATRWLLDNIKFENEQGESMILNKGDMLAKSRKDSTQNYYRIEAGAFDKTYVQASN